jgi:excisionase family DNA binding protein
MACSPHWAGSSFGNSSTIFFLSTLRAIPSEVTLRPMNQTAAVVTRSTPINELPELMTPHEAAAWLGVSVWSVYDLARRGDIASTRLGRNVRIQRRGLAQLAGRRGDDAAA